jgi:hypothetical protein
MDCCNHNSNGSSGNNQKNQHAHHGGHMSHMWMMALCCGAPLILLFAVSLLGTGLPGVKAVLLNVVPFICPIMMIGMILMMFMHGKHDDNCSEEKQGDKNALNVP